MWRNTGPRMYLVAGLGCCHCVLWEWQRLNINNFKTTIDCVLSPGWTPLNKNVGWNGREKTNPYKWITPGLRISLHYWLQHQLRSKSKSFGWCNNHPNHYNVSSYAFLSLILTSTWYHDIALKFDQNWHCLNWGVVGLAGVLKNYPDYFELWV